MQKDDYGFIYVWYDRKNKMFYVGCHWGLETDKYVCSSERMRSAYRRRPEDFRRRVVQRIVNRSELLTEEHKWLSQIKDEELGKKFYNLSKHHFGHWSTSPDARSIAKKSGDARRGRKMVVEADRGAKISAAKQAKRAERIAAGWSPKSRPKKGGQPGRPKLPPRFCGICNVDTGSPRRSYCQEHRYEAMNKTRSLKPDSKWFTL